MRVNAEAPKKYIVPSIVFYSVGVSLVSGYELPPACIYPNCSMIEERKMKDTHFDAIKLHLKNYEIER